MDEINIPNIDTLNALALAYLGDGVYEVYIRLYLLKQGIVKVNDLQKKAVPFVSAKGQASFIERLIKENKLNEEEIGVVYRARNHKVSSHPRNTDIVTYKWATGLEALVGYLFIEKKNERINEIMEIITNYKNN